ncbi:50S ribosomal protein L24 [Candidatus Shapirobacteria bacterium]|nr:50S ribosomal protein L24 [Candidatus Shapirobacteria bacterium]
MKLKKGDKVRVFLGKDRGKEGAIDKIFSKTKLARVSGINLYKKHQKSQGQGKPGGIIDITVPLPVSSLRLICPRCGQPARVGWKVNPDRSKNRICHKCQEAI